MAPLHLHLQNKAQPLHCHPRPFTVRRNPHLFNPLLQALSVCCSVLLCAVPPFSPLALEWGS